MIIHIYERLNTLPKWYSKFLINEFLWVTVPSLKKKIQNQGGDMIKSLLVLVQFSGEHCNSWANINTHQ